ncbi:3762_t:CDS:2 [Ambispora gerdemannii]|uniref:3762_t:CDS:1 n=1 Tax=Ambispora gerdemannii TaxID=144530 RepID=A0A9N9CAU0_9GLOM|nr:3762_t:CDS:2 [Ambispora gerdemannii]
MSTLSQYYEDTSGSDCETVFFDFEEETKEHRALFGNKETQEFTGQVVQNQVTPLAPVQTSHQLEKVVAREYLREELPINEQKTKQGLPIRQTLPFESSVSQNRLAFDDFERNKLFNVGENEKEEEKENRSVELLPSSNNHPVVSNVFTQENAQIGRVPALVTSRLASPLNSRRVIRDFLLNNDEAARETEELRMFLGDEYRPFSSSTLLSSMAEVLLESENSEGDEEAIDGDEDVIENEDDNDIEFLRQQAETIDAPPVPILPRQNAFIILTLDEAVTLLKIGA